MNNSGLKKISIEERLRMIKESKAASPEAAAAKIRMIGAFPPVNMMNGTSDLELLFDECGIGRFDGFPGIDINHYSEFVPFFRYALWGIKDRKTCRFTETRDGVMFINSMILLALMLLDRLKQKGKDLSFYNAFNMSLRDFWDAAVGTCVTSDGAIDEERKRRMMHARDVYMMTRDIGVSIRDELASILNMYQDGWYSYGKIEHILACDEELTDYMLSREDAERAFEEEYNPEDYEDDYEDDYEYEYEFEYEYDLDSNVDEEELEQYYRDTEADLDAHNLFTDPIGYFLDQADDFVKPVDDFRDDKVRHIRREIFLAGNYGKADLEDLRRSIRHTAFQKKFDEIVNSPDFENSKLICESSAMLIYHLMVSPFIDLNKYHFERFSVTTL